MAKHAHKNTIGVFAAPALRARTRWDGLRIGLLGGSFNPAHAGHRHIARVAMAKCRLDFVWWLVTPQNPLKSATHTAPYAARVASVQKVIAGHPRMMAAHLESELGTTYTYETVTGLLKHFPKTRFTFICGMDNALIFHRWDRWTALADLLPIVFIARPPASNLVRNFPARMVGHRNISFIPMVRMLDISSTEIRKKDF